MGDKGMKYRISSLFLGAALAMATTASVAGEAVVTAAKASKTNAGWRFDVTVQHADTGWEHYADAWRVVGKDGTVFGTRTLYHPHVDEQPFTRSLSGVAIPSSVTEVIVESHDSVHGWGGAQLVVKLP